MKKENVWRILFLSCIFLLIQCRNGPDIDVSKPLDLDKLDPGVLVQFQNFWDSAHQNDVDKRQQGQAWGKLGQWFKAYKYRSSAAKCFDVAARLNPEEGRWPYFHAIIAWEESDMELAQRLAQQSASIAPEMPDPLLLLGDLAFAQGKDDEAEPFYKKVLSMDANQGDALLGMSKIFLRRMEAEKALPLLEQVERDQPNASEVQYLLGRTWSLLKDPDRAKAYLEKVPKQDNEKIALKRCAWVAEIESMNTGMRQLNLAAVNAARDGHLEYATNKIRQAVQMNPENPDLLVNYGIILYRDHFYEGALEQLEKAISLNPKNSRAYLVKGQVYKEMKAPKKAEELFLKASELDPRDTAPHIELGKLFQQYGFWKKAIDQYDQVRAVSRPLVSARFWYAALLLRIGQDKGALEGLDEDLKKAPNDPLLLGLKIRILAASPDVSLQDVDEAGRLLGTLNPPSNIFDAETAAMVEARRGNFDLAQKWERRALAGVSDMKAQKAEQIAGRRLALYEMKEACQTPWERQENLVLKPLPEKVNK